MNNNYPNADENTLARAAGQAMQARKFAEAEPLLRELDARLPGKYASHLSLAIFNLGHYDEALPLLQHLVDIGNTDISCILAYAACLERTGNEDKSIGVLEQLYRALPNEQFAVLLSSALLRMARADLLEKRLPELLNDHPGHVSLLSTLSEYSLTRGNFATGFDLIHHRWDSSSLEPSKAATLDCAVWNGVRFDGLLLVTAEQGIGDEILASSMLEDLVRLKQDALVECDVRLLPVFRRSFPALSFTDRHGNGLQQEITRGKTCRKIPALELGRFFRRDGAAFPQRRRWLESDPVRRAQLRDQLTARFPGKRLTGVSWRSARMFLGAAKSIPLADLAPVLSEPGTVFIDLQYGDTRADRDALLAQTGLVIHRVEEVDTHQDIDGLFALIDALDDVVSSSNSTVHIAGALGKPVAAMIPGTRYSLWYWGYDGDTTPWYPSVHLWRGPMQRSWAELAGLLATQRAAKKTESGA